MHYAPELYSIFFFALIFWNELYFHQSHLPRHQGSFCFRRCRASKIAIGFKGSGASAGEKLMVGLCFALGAAVPSWRHALSWVRTGVGGGQASPRAPWCQDCGERPLPVGQRPWAAGDLQPVTRQASPLGPGLGACRGLEKVVSVLRTGVWGGWLSWWVGGCYSEASVAWGLDKPLCGDHLETGALR